jgi:hypothetical protein
VGPISAWEKYKTIVYPNDVTAKKRQTTYTVICLDCETSRTVCYAQAWNIVKNNNSGRCQSCAENNKEDRGKKKVEKKHRRKLVDVLKYRNMFENPAKDPSIRQKMREAKLGKINEEANNWQGGKRSERLQLMARDEYKQLRKLVFQRDGFKCVLCFSNKELQMDHIKEWCNYPELRFEAANCRTLCFTCHKQTDNYATKAIKKKKELKNGT